MEKEADIMRQEIKISLPFYKIVYAIFFVVVLSLIRGVFFTYEIGIALEAPMAILASVFCADTYIQEIISKRSEIQKLYPIKKRIYSIFERLLIQEIYLFLLAVMSYGLFFLFQNPFSMNETNHMQNEIIQFAVYLVAIVITLIFWGILSNTLAILSHNMWFGMGGCLVLWLITNSTLGERFFGSCNLFSYTFRNIEDNSDFTWMYGKIICIGLGFIMMAILPEILKKRG